MRWKLILTISLPLLVMIGMLLLGDYVRVQRAAMQQLQGLITEAATSAATQLDSRLESIRQLADSTAESLTARPNIQPVQLQTLLRSHMRQNNLVYATLIAFEPGMVGDNTERLAPAMVRTPRAPRSVDLEKLIDYTSEAYPWFAPVKYDEKPVWTAAYTAPYLGDQRVVSYSAPFFLGEVFRGVVTISVRVDDLQQLIERATHQVKRVVPAAESAGLMGNPTRAEIDAVTLPPQRYVVFDRRGFVLACSDPDNRTEVSVFAATTRLGLTELDDAAHEALSGGVKTVRTDHLDDLFKGFDPDEYHWVAFAGLNSTGWVFTTALGESVVMDPIMRHLRDRAGLMLIGLLALMLLVLVLAVRMSKPIERMADAVDQLAHGNLDVRVTGIRRRDEIGQLADGFNTMVAQLNHHVDELTRQSAEREKVESELRIARQIQTDLLPRHDPPFPDYDEFDLYGTNVPARHVAGDFFDYFFAPNNLLNIVIADVSGKGVPAAMLMAVTRTIVRNLAMTGLSPAEIIDAANRMLVEDTAVGVFVTMFIAQYDPDTGKLVYCNAGHPSPVYFGTSNGAGLLGDITAPVLGVAGVELLGPITQKQEIIDVGETMLLYTDGVTEARSPESEFFGEEHLLDLVNQLDHDEPRQLCTLIVEALDLYQQGQVADDITLLALRRRK
ncbi:SpoIIE family protein phosphatase [Planctomycetales bacterium ZRK34]|nr:SpoIIE family protein phosphatase [Planctomycetales bacterium ZRK34]